MRKTVKTFTTLWLFIFLLILATSNKSYSQTAESIIEKHIEAVGGIDNYKKLESLRINGRFTAFSLVKPYEMIWLKPGKYYMEYSLGKHDVIEAFNGKQGWVIDPWQEITFPRKANATEENVYTQKATLVSPFLKFTEGEISVEYLGEDDTNGEDTYILKVTKPGNYVETWYLSTDTYLPVKYNSVWVDFARPSDAETFFDDFRSVGGVKIPHYIERTFGQRHRVTEIESVEINPEDVCKDKLTMPRCEHMEMLSFLEGDYSVEYFVRTRADQWHQLDKTSSKIRFTDLNKLTEKISYERFLVFDRVNTFHYSSANEKYVFTMYQGHGSDMSFFLGEFVDDKLVFESTKLQTEKTSENPSPIYRHIYSDITDNGFTLVVKWSNDNGETFRKGDKFVYTKIGE